MADIKNPDESIKKINRGKFFWFFLVIIGFGVIILSNSRSQSAATSDVKEFKISAFKYYFDPNVITVKRGDRVKIIIDNVDVLHGIKIPELSLSGNEVVEFTADKNGEFIWYCNTYCGSDHRQMQGKLIVQ